MLNALKLKKIMKLLNRSFKHDFVFVAREREKKNAKVSVGRK
jgi:hypothetical protein